MLLDLGLPDTHELDGLRWLQDNVPSVAVVVLTGLADEYLGEEAVRLGAQDYLVKGQVDGPLLDRVIRYAVERERSDELQRQLRDAQIYAEENGRLERGLLPTPIVDDPGPAGHRAVLARWAAAAARRRLLRRGPDRRRHRARGRRRRLRPRPRRGRARRVDAGRVAHDGARRPADRPRCSRSWTRCSPTSGTSRTCSPRCACSSVDPGPHHRHAAPGRPPAAAADHRRRRA